MSLIFRDTFTDTDGTFLKDHAPDFDALANGWTDPVDDYIINSNQLYLSSGGDQAAKDLGVDTYTVQAVVGVNGLASYSNGFKVRYVDSNNYIIVQFYSYGNIHGVLVTKKEAGVLGDLINVPQFPAVIGDYKLTAAVTPTDIIIYVDGKKIATVSNSSFGTSTKIGINIAGSTNPYLDEMAAWDTAETLPPDGNPPENDLRVFDNFDSPGIFLLNTLTPPIDIPGGGWANIGSNFNVWNYALYQTVVPGTIGYKDIGITDFIYASDTYVRSITNFHFELRFRIIDNNNYLVFRIQDIGISTKAYLAKIEGGIFTYLSTSETFTPAISTRYKLKVVNIGNVIRCYINNILYFEVETDLFDTATKVSFDIISTDIGGGSSSMDNLYVAAATSENSYTALTSGFPLDKAKFYQRSVCDKAVDGYTPTSDYEDEDNARDNSRNTKAITQWYNSDGIPAEYIIEFDFAQEVNFIGLVSNAKKFYIRRWDGAAWVDFSPELAYSTDDGIAMIDFGAYIELEKFKIVISETVIPDSEKEITGMFFAVKLGEMQLTAGTKFTEKIVATSTTTIAGGDVKVVSYPNDGKFWLDATFRNWEGDNLETYQAIKDRNKFDSYLIYCYLSNIERLYDAGAIHLVNDILDREASPMDRTLVSGIKGAIKLREC